MKNILVLASAALLPWFAHADGLDAALQAKVDAQVKIIETWATDPAVVQAVQAHNAAPSADAAAMTQDKWKAVGELLSMVGGSSSLRVPASANETVVTLVPEQIKTHRSSQAVPDHQLAP